ncbi:PEP/pyruvate-binding domain-containing protein [Sunxiuqinia sp. sy24]|uniref:PEP/pyruvate-binding domain-containing protein n=1 Tax=Sunxiuqinia sp. sy24 TaxID=3461495 RepID=UPI0040458306
MNKESKGEKQSEESSARLELEQKLRLSAIGQAVVKQIEGNSKLASLLKSIANEIVKGASPEVISVSISYNNQEFVSRGFKHSAVVLRSLIETSEQPEGVIEIFFNTDLIQSENFEAYLAVKEQLPYWRTIIGGAIANIRLRELNHLHTERQKELTGIDKANEILAHSHSLAEGLSELCQYLPNTCQHPKYARARIVLDNQVYVSDRFKESQWHISQSFETPDKKQGQIELFYVRKLAGEDGSPFLSEEQRFLKSLSSLVSGAVSKYSLESLLVENGERLKELKGINKTAEILKRSRKLEESLSRICAVLPASFQYPDDTVVRINYGGKSYESLGFKETPWKIKQFFQTDTSKKGSIEVFYTKAFPDLDEGPFLKEERELLNNLAELIAGRAVKNMLNRLLHANTERLKELQAINQTSKIIEESNSVYETLQRICNILPQSWQYPKYTACRIRFGRDEYVSPNFEESPWVQKDQLMTVDNKKGSIEIFYLKDFPEADEGPFLREERDLIRNICQMVNGYLNGYKGFEIISNKGVVITNPHRSEEFRKSLVRNKKPLQLYFNQQSLEKYVYLDMMKYKVKHILFVSTLYDAFMLESEDSFFEKFMGEIYQYSLFSLPRITGVSSAEEALELLETTNFDLVILMAGLDRKAPIELSEQIREQHKTIPIYLLVNKKSDLNYFEKLLPTIGSVDQLFVWNGDSLILFAIVKSIEDRVNVENDTRVGLVRVILVIEDSPLYYSKYLQFLYSIIFDQVQQILPEVEKNELDKIGRMRSRPKVLLAKNYEEATAIFNKYKDFILCVISDMEFERGGKIDKKAGVDFIQYAKSNIHKLPVILQSSEVSNRRYAKKLDVMFLDKNSETLIQDLKHFLKNYLGFGNFVFLNAKDEKIAVARSLREFETMLRKIPDESFYLHALENNFSLWLMARGEIQLAKTLNPVPVNSMENVGESRKFFLETITRYKEEKKKGRIMGFDETATLDERNIVSFCSGSLGGKGRGLAFINVLIYNYDFSALASQINISTPITVIVGTTEFQNFISRNNLREVISNPEISYKELREHFYEANLSSSLMRKLKIYVNQIDKPVAVRSSSTSEDSITHPFSGVFDTYIIPNCKQNKRKVAEHLANAIKMVYASIYSDGARTYFEAIQHRVEDEQMAIVLQEVVGDFHGDHYYPHISGVAQSFNYYPVADMKPEEGFAVAALGLGTYVVSGWKSYRFSPVYPKVSVYNIKDLLNSTQVKFYALNCSNLDLDLLNKGELAALDLLDIEEAEKHGTLKHCVSVYNPDNDTVEPGLDTYGPRVVNFANILQYEYIPLAKTIDTILHAVEGAFGSPVEIEYAVDLTPGKHGLPTFYLLQIKPLLASIESHYFDFNAIEPGKMLLRSGMSLGNGEISKITDVIYVPPEKFSKLKTMEMAAEIEALNNLMVKEKRKYILIGPGRWGTRDQFLGIPVNWAQISNAKVIVETSLENFPLDSSLGSHFFHNVTSMNIGYFSVIHNSSSDVIRWDMLQDQTMIAETTYFKHVRFDSPLRVVMNGKTKTAAVIIS